MHTLWGSVVTRVLAFVAIFVAARFVPTPSDVVGINVRLGLLVFGLSAALAAIWSFTDALAEVVRTTFVRWGITAVIVGLLQPVLGLLEPGGSWSWAVVLDDLVTLGIFMAGLIAVPALVSAWLAHTWVTMPSDEDRDAARQATGEPIAS